MENSLARGRRRWSVACLLGRVDTARLVRRGWRMGGHGGGGEKNRPWSKWRETVEVLERRDSGGNGVKFGRVLELRPLADDGAALGIKTLLHLDVHDRRGCRLDIPKRLFVSRRLEKTGQSFDFGQVPSRGKMGSRCSLVSHLERIALLLVRRSKSESLLPLRHSFALPRKSHPFSRTEIFLNRPSRTGRARTQIQLWWELGE
jgi:hypothetical protein